MWRTVVCRLCVLVLISILLEVPATALPINSERQGSWWQSSLETLIDRILDSLRDGGWSYLAGDDADALSVEGEGPQTLDGDDPVPSPLRANSYPGLDPDG